MTTDFFPKHEKWLLCKPDLFGVEYEINPWMHVTDQPDKGRAMQQWLSLEGTLKKIGLTLNYIKQEVGVPDQVFTANGALVLEKRCVLPHFHYHERQKEMPFFRDWFEKNGYDLYYPEKHTFEGEGDALFQGDVLFAGYGFRSEMEVYEGIQRFLGFNHLVPVKLLSARFYHLDTCFAPVANKLAIFHPEAFSAESIKQMEKFTELVQVPRDDADRFCCNCVVAGKDVVLPAGNAATRKILESRGFVTHEVDLSEFKKAGGAAKCLSLKI